MLVPLPSLAALAALLPLAAAIPAFPDLSSLSNAGGLARRAPSASPEEMAELRRRFQLRIAAQTEQVKNDASTYPVEYRSNVSDSSMWADFQDTGKLPQPIRGNTGSTQVGPHNTPIDRQNPDMLAPPSTDHGTVPNAAWPFALSHNRLQTGGWARQQNVKVLPVATEMAGVNMRLEEGAIRELHWHQSAEWAYIIKGTFRVGAVDEDGRNEIGDVGPGDVWYFPSGVPHYIQALSKGGGEFLLVFDDGNFSEDSTLLLTDFTAHIPREVAVKNFPGLSNDDFNKVPGEQLYIFPAKAPGDDKEQVKSPAGDVPNSFIYPFSKDPVKQLNGGTVKILDTRKFPVSKTISAALVTVEPGAMRELHWHPLSDEWDYFLSGSARITVFAGDSNARTYNFQAGSVGYLQKSVGHYVENIGNDTLTFLEVFKSPRYSDISLSNWLALTPPKVVQAHLGFSDATMKKLEQFRSKDHQVVKRGMPMVAGKRSWA